MIRGTTPIYTLTIDGYDLTEYTVYVTIRNNTTITLTGDRPSIASSGSGQTLASAVVFELTQEETLALKTGAGMVQMRFIDQSGTALATDIAQIRIEPVLYERVIEYGEG